MVCKNWVMRCWHARLPPHHLVLHYTPFTRYNRLSNRLYNRFDNWLYRVNRHPTGCQMDVCLHDTADLTTVLTWTNSHCSFNRVVKPGCTTIWQPAVYIIQPVCQTGCQTGLTTGWMFVYTIQPVVILVWQPDWQQVVSCKRGFRIQINLAFLVPVYPVSPGKEAVELVSVLLYCCYSSSFYIGLYVKLQYFQLCIVHKSWSCVMYLCVV